MNDITYIDRSTKDKCIEKVYGGSLLKFLYGTSACSRLLGSKLAYFVAKNAWISHLYGLWQNQSWTKSKIKPFVRDFKVDSAEFLEPLENFTSFNDFFTRKLKSSARPITDGNNTAIIPADGRYLFYEDISQCDGFIVKGKKFDLQQFLNSQALADTYRDGSMVIARLCPSDYHRFHFPCACIPEQGTLINGLLYSVNPIAIKQNIDIFAENKRELTKLHTEKFDTLLYIEVGATNVGTITQTYVANKRYSKGAEKGFFSFGGSTLVLLFSKGIIQFDQDLLAATAQGYEIKCLMGQSMGVKKSKETL